MDIYSLALARCSTRYCIVLYCNRSGQDATRSDLDEPRDATRPRQDEPRCDQDEPQDATLIRSMSNMAGRFMQHRLREYIK